MTKNRSERHSEPATRRGFLRDALRQALGAGASVSGVGAGAALAVGGVLADSAAAAKREASLGPFDDPFTDAASYEAWFADLGQDRLAMEESTGADAAKPEEIERAIADGVDAYLDDRDIAMAALEARWLADVADQRTGA